MALATVVPSERYWALVDWLTDDGLERSHAIATASALFEWLHDAGLHLQTDPVYGPEVPV